MNAMILDPEVRTRIAEIVEFASRPENITVRSHLAEYESGTRKVPGDIPGHVIVIPLDYRTVFSIVKDGEKFFRRMSMSVSRQKKGKVPHPLGFVEVAKEFGFDAHLNGVSLESESGRNLQVHFEDIGSGMHAVNLAQQFGEEESKHLLEAWNASQV